MQGKYGMACSLQPLYSPGTVSWPKACPICAAVLYSQNLHFAIHQDEEQRVEAARLTDKLSSGLVCGVWLQMGSDHERLEAALQFINEAITEYCPDRRPQVYGALFPLNMYCPAYVSVLAHINMHVILFPDARSTSVLHLA